MDLVRRSAWGAAPPKGEPIPIATPVRDLYLHHSAGPDGGPSTVRSIQKFHQNGRGWADIAYTWLYSPRDRMFYEGRGPGIAGAHTRGHNRTAHGLCVLGNYEIHPLPATAIADLAAWAEWHGGTWGPAVWTPHNAVVATICPGLNILNVIDRINSIAASPIDPVTPQLQLPPTIRRGDTGDDVKLLQAVVLPHDGMFGPKTEEALKAYQTSKGLKPDGICGPATWATILST